MNIHLRYFASLREATGRDAETLDVAAGSDVAAIRELLAECYPSAAPILARCAAALNRAYVAADTPLHDGDELVFIPPVGGG
ncbi:MAG TPA: molybdopterin converting factor subunit 1 [Ktedonobacterales bacterium]